MPLQRLRLRIRLSLPFLRGIFPSRRVTKTVVPLLGHSTFRTYLGTNVHVLDEVSLPPDCRVKMRWVLTCVLVESRTGPCHLQESTTHDNKSRKCNIKGLLFRSPVHIRVLCKGRVSETVCTSTPSVLLPTSFSKYSCGPSVVYHLIVKRTSLVHWDLFLIYPLRTPVSIPCRTIPITGGRLPTRLSSFLRSVRLTMWITTGIIHETKIYSRTKRGNQPRHLYQPFSTPTSTKGTWLFC